jgi:hypothetical protein
VPLLNTSDSERPSPPTAPRRIGGGKHRATSIDRAPSQPAEVTPTRVLGMLADTHTLTDVLRSVCILAVESIADCDSASLAVIDDGIPLTVVSSDQRATRIDEAQLRDGQGPCPEAARIGSVVQAEALPQSPVEDGWHRVARDIGITAALSVPVVTSTQVVAVLNLYASTSDGWAGHSLAAAEDLAAYIGETITMTDRLTLITPPRLSSATDAVDRDVSPRFPE